MKVYIAIKAGGGPEDDFRYYLRSSVRNTYVSMVRARRTAPAGDAIEEVIGDDGAEAATVTRFDGSVTARAFLSLPTRWQEVLWYTEVEGLSREHTASLLGMNANAVSALAFRAREALRTAWLQQHVSAQQGLEKDCEAVTPLLGAHSRQTLPRRDRVRVEQHLSGCGRCTSVVDELADLLTPGRLALVLLPVLAGGATAAAFASKIAAGSAVMTSASASTIGSPAATVVATVGGSTAASGGAAAMAVVGKVAGVRARRRRGDRSGSDPHRGVRRRARPHALRARRRRASLAHAVERRPGSPARGPRRRSDVGVRVRRRRIRRW